MFKKKFLQILQMLGFVEKANQQQLTDADWKAIDSEFTKEFGMSIADALAENKANESMLADRNAALEIINASESDDDDDDDDNDDNDDEPDKKANSLERKVATIIANSEKQVATITALQSKIDKMAKIATPDTPASVVTRQITAFGGLTTKNHLFGIEHSMFDMKKRWNQIAANPNFAKLGEPSEEDGKAFESEVRTFGASMAQRYKFLHDNKMLGALASNGTFDNDLSELGNAGLGQQYVTLRQDALIARILTIPTMYGLFPRRSNVKDRELMTIAYFQELSQAYQRGHVFKGGMKLQPEMGHVDTAMFKTEFGPMEQIETEYLGYINTNSDQMKWSMIEWQLLNMYEVLINEQNTRVARGCFVAPEAGIPGSYLNAGTGLLYTLQRFMHENKLLPHSNEIYNNYDEATMLEAVNLFLDDVTKVLDENESLDNKFIYLNQRHRPWWIKAIRAQFGKDTDFTGTDSYANVVPDYDVKIKWVPNLGAKNKLMLIQEHGNLQALEFIPGEMLGVKMDTAMELVHVWSRWKEGFSAFIVGKSFNSLEELKANNHSMQTIFMNKPLTLLDEDATTIDASQNYWFGTGKNTEATAITEIKDAKNGVVYVIECEDATFPSSIDKAGQFESILSAYTPTKVGDYIMVTLNSKGKFIELERRMDGVRAINKVAQPNIIGPGGR